MEDETQNFNSNHYPENRFISRDSFISRMSENRSIDRYSQRLSGNSPSRRSIFDVMNVDTPLRNSSYRRVSEIDEDSTMRILRFSNQSEEDLGRLSQHYEMFEDIPNFMEEERVSQFHPNHLPVAGKFKNHECDCVDNDCSEDLCPCSFYPEELCLNGLCCENCIQRKNKKMAQLSLEAPIQKGLKHLPKKKEAKNVDQQRKNKLMEKLKNHKKKGKFDFIYCSCKKTQCSKKYCPCYAMNKECNECCICEECQNGPDSESESEKLYKMQRFGRRSSSQEELEPEKEELERAGGEKQEKSLNQNIDEYFDDEEEDYSQMEMVNDMDFEPANFEEYTNRRSSNAQCKSRRSSQVGAEKRASIAHRMDMEEG